MIDWLRACEVVVNLKSAKSLGLTVVAGLVDGRVRSNPSSVGGGGAERT
jgi:hypothetical protein